MSRDVVDLSQMLTNIKGGGNFYIFLKFRSLYGAKCSYHKINNDLLIMPKICAKII